MHLLHAADIEKSFGDRHVLRGATLTIGPGDRVGLVGVNGSGKSTLLRILSGKMPQDHGRLDRVGTQGLLEQIPDLPGQTVREALDEAVGWHARLLAEYHAALDRQDLGAAATLQERLDREGWTVAHKVAGMMQRLGTPPGDARLERLSGGEKRRIALARVLLEQPDLLMLDEPTNHLDADTCEWLEGLLASWRGGVLLVTHDRYLLESVATRIVEIEDGETVAYEGSYTDYLISRAERQARLEKAEDKRLALIEQEAAWAARSPAARSTKQKARLLRLDALRDQRALLRRSEFDLELKPTSTRSGPLLEARGLKMGFGGRTLMRGLDLVLRPGERLGILGPNGAGKSTLLRILSGEIQPQAGELVRAPRLSAAVLDQHRTGLDLDQTVWEAAGDGNDHVFVNEKPVHVASFLERFQFPREIFDQKCRALSGGERARLLLARLVLHGANLLLLDEPTNDLDLMTLRILESALLEYEGAAVVVTHDRAFLDRVCTGVLAFEGEGQVVAYASRQQHTAALKAREAAAAAAAPAPAPAAARAASNERNKKLSYKERQEFEALPGRIEALEGELERLHTQLSDPSLYEGGGEQAIEVGRRAEALPAEIEALYERWAELEERAG